MKKIRDLLSRDRMEIMLKRLPLFLCGLALLLSAPAQAQRVDQLPSQARFPPQKKGESSILRLAEGVAVVVNESVISTGDVLDRLDLALLSSGVPNVPEVRQRLFPQIVRALIEEQLQLQEGEKLGIDVSDDELQKALGKLAQDNKIPSGDMEVFLKSNNVPPSALRAQVKAALMWSKVVMREVRPRIDIGDEEIDAAVEALKENAGKQEYMVSEIFLEIEMPENEEQVRVFSQKLVDQIKEGAVFGAVARQFSQGTGAGTGGDIGWVRVGELAPEVDELLLTMKVGDVAGPVRSEAGYHILGVRDRRVISFGDPEKIKVNVGQAFRAFSNQIDKDELFLEAKNLRAKVKGCEGIEEKLKASYPAWSWQDLGEVALGDAPPWLFEKVSALQKGAGSEPMATDKGAAVLFLCSRSVPENIDRDAIRNAIGAEKLERMAQRLLRDLRRDAFLDIRLKAAP